MNTIRPNCRCRIPGSTAWASRNGARRLTASVTVERRRVDLLIRAPRASPWFATRTSTGPSPALDLVHEPRRGIRILQVGPERRGTDVRRAEISDATAEAASAPCP